MSTAPTQPKLYHITLAENLPKVIAAGGLWSDTERIIQNLDTNLIGMGKIKQRRLRYRSNATLEPRLASSFPSACALVR